MILLALLLVATLGLSFLCSVLEAVILSVTPSYVSAMETRGHRLSAHLASFKRDTERPLAAILTLNTIANTAGATLVGAQALLVFGDAWVALVSGVLTILVLFLSEIIPKTLGAIYWRTLAPASVLVIQALVVSLLPFVAAGTLLRRLLGTAGAAEKMSQEEMHAMADLGHQEGLLERGESRILQSVIRFGSLNVHDIMTPRTVVVAFPEQMTVREVLDHQTDKTFPSRYPVYGRNIDNVTGYVLRDDLLLRAAEGEAGMRLVELRRDISALPETQPLRAVFSSLVSRRDQIAIVVDQYGGTAGIVTMEDVVETLLGLELVDESDVARDMQSMARAQWERRALQRGINLDELADDTGDDEPEPKRKT